MGTSPYFGNWMTGSECAEWWTSLLRKRADADYAANEKRGLGANTPVGFVICWADNSVNTAADIFVLDPARLGQGSGAASAGGSKWGILTDVGRATAFIPLGRLVKVGAGLRAGANDLRAAAEAPAAADALGGMSNVPKAAENAISKLPAEAAKALAPGAVRLEIDASAKAFFGTMKDMCRISDPGGPICWAVSLVRAMQKSGKYLMSLDDLARIIFGDAGRAAELGSQLHRTTRAFIDYLVSLNVKHFVLEIDSIRVTGLERKLAEAWRQFSRLSGGRDGWMVFTTAFKKAANAEYSAHTMLARVLPGGTLQIFDRSSLVVQTLKDLENLRLPDGRVVPFYSGIGSSIFKPRDVLVFIPESEVALKPGAVGLMAAPFTAGSMLGPLMIPVKVIPSIVMSVK